MTKRERIEQKREQYRREMLEKIRNGNDVLGKPWEVAGMSEHEYGRNGGEYEVEIDALELARHDVTWASMLCGWKVYGVDMWDRICAIGEQRGAIRRVRPSRKEREFPGGFGSPINWPEILG